MHLFQDQNFSFKIFICFFYLLRWVLRLAGQVRGMRWMMGPAARRRGCPPGGRGGTALVARAAWRPPIRLRRPSGLLTVSTLFYLPVLHFSNLLFSSKFRFLRSFSTFFRLWFDVRLAIQASTKLTTVRGAKTS